jgi:hypothetical protein
MVLWSLATVVGLDYRKLGRPSPWSPPTSIACHAFSLAFSVNNIVCFVFLSTDMYFHHAYRLLVLHGGCRLALDADVLDADVPSYFFPRLLLLLTPRSQ